MVACEQGSGVGRARSLRVGDVSGIAAGQDRPLRTTKSGEGESPEGCMWKLVPTVGVLETGRQSDGECECVRGGEPSLMMAAMVATGMGDTLCSPCGVSGRRPFRYAGSADAGCQCQVGQRAGEPGGCRIQIRGIAGDLN